MPTRSDSQFNNDRIRNIIISNVRNSPTGLSDQLFSEFGGPINGQVYRNERMTENRVATYLENFGIVP